MMYKIKEKGISLFGQKVHFFIYLLTFFLTLSGSAYSQTGDKISVKGVVTDQDGEPLIGATVSEKGTTNATMTDVDGAYTLSISSNGTLTATFVGFHVQEIAVSGKTIINIKLVEDSKILDEVVVTALGIKKQSKALGYAVAEVKGDDITKGRDGNAITALSGRMAGVDISSGSGGPSGSTRVIIRGNSQLSGSNQPLYVVDGVPMDNTQLGSADQNGGYDMGDGLAAINPGDIESVSVLKGASAAALYGSRASNGVILITTKSGKGQNGLGIDFSSNVNAVSILSKFDDYQRVYGQGINGEAPLLQSNAQTSTQNAWGAKLDPNLILPIYNGELKSYENRNNNILDFFRTGITYTNSLALYNSSEKADYRVSVSDMRNKDIVPSSDMYRTTFMIKGAAKLGQKIQVEGRANYTKEGVNNRPALSDSPNNIGNSIIGIAPNFDQKWLATGYKDELGRYNPWNANIYRLNPYWVINEMTNKSIKDRLLGNLQGTYQILPYLAVYANVGTDVNKFRFTDFAPKYTDGIQAGRMAETSIDMQETNIEGRIRFNKTFDDALDVTAFVGGNIMQRKYESFINTGNTQNIPGIESITNYLVYKLEHDDVRKQVNSLYGALNLGYKNFAYVDFTIRNDVTTTLYKDNNSYIYPSASGSFVFSEIIDLKSIGLSFGKVRGSWAKVGGDTDPYLLLNSYNLLPYNVGGLPLGQLASTGKMPNLNLKPTSTYSYEFGTDLRFLNSRLNLDFNYFYSITKDQIMNLPISVTSGYNSAMINAGEIEKKGIEVALTAIPVQTRDFEWTANISLAKISNKVKELYPGIDYYELTSARWAGASVVAKVGENFGSIMGKKFARNENGDVIYNEQGMPTYTSDVAVLGNGNYDFTMGISNTFRYKDFSLGVLLDMKFGGDIYSMSAWNSHYNGTSKNTLEGRESWYASEEARKAANKTQNEWTPTGGYVGKGVVPVKDADGKITGWIPNTTPVNPQAYWRTVADNTPEPFIYDASYIKLRELSLTYTVPAKALAKTPIRGLSFTAYGRNLFVLHSDLKNIDPESSYNMSNGQGLEYGSLPSRRTYGFGLNLKF